MKAEYLSFLSKFSEEQKELFETYIQERDHNSEDLLVTDSVTGEINSTCRGSGRPLFKKWNRFDPATVIKEGNDWSIFGTAHSTINNRRQEMPFVIDLLESDNIFEVRIGGRYPWRAKLTDRDAISYRLSGNKIIIRAIKVQSTNVSYCYITGMIAAETSSLKSPEEDD